MDNNMRSIRAGATGYADEARGLTGQALETTKEFASHALDVAAERARNLRYGARDLASRGVSTVGDYAQTTTRYVRDEPIRSALIAAAIGATIAALVIAARRYNDRY
jgi:ElaB/YqjD/DUF883 family membrane-anchored ribosome-binding protein